VSVFIDDRLPQRKGSYCYAHSSDPNEFWVNKFKITEQSFLNIFYSFLSNSHEPTMFCSGWRL
jgi:hypothetical protein